MEVNKAMELMTQGNVCSESVLLATCQEFGLEIDNKLIPRSLRSLPATPCGE
jgi:hypothetical protein